MSLTHVASATCLAHHGIPQRLADLDAHLAVNYA
jgi:hypothetical protein